jgi:hypothetical protein
MKHLMHEFASRLLLHSSRNHPTFEPARTAECPKLPEPLFSDPSRTLVLPHPCRGA